MKTKMRKRCVGARACVVALVVVVVAPAAQAQTRMAADKSHYHLFNPTPRGQMRELSADRPDVTESPYTVDAGHVQLEMSFVDYVYDD